MDFALASREAGGARQPWVQGQRGHLGGAGAAAAHLEAPCGADRSLRRREQSALPCRSGRGTADTGMGSCLAKPADQVVPPLESKGSPPHAAPAAPPPPAADEEHSSEAQAAARQGYAVSGKLERRDSFSEVFSALRKDGGDVAVRCIPFDHPAFEHDAIRGELQKLVAMGHHPGIAQIHDVWEDSDTMYYSQAAHIGSDLVETVAEWDAFSEGDAAAITQQVLSALDFMHAKAGAHSDLRLKNFRLVGPDRKVLLIEGGLHSLRGNIDTKLIRNIFNRSHPLHLPPEMAQVVNARGKANNDMRGDIWAAGVLTYILVCGFPPIFSENVAVFLQRLETGEWTFPQPEADHVREPVREFVRAILITDPAARPSAAGALNLPWLSAIATLPTEPLGVKTSLADYVSKHRTKKAKNVVMAVGRMGASMGGVGSTRALEKASS